MISILAIIVQPSSQRPLLMSFPLSICLFICLVDRTNLPKEVMMFPDFPFDPQLSSFLPHQEVQRYLERYCRSHRIRPHIRVSPPPSPSLTEERWRR